MAHHDTRLSSKDSCPRQAGLLEVECPQLSGCAAQFARLEQLQPQRELRFRMFVELMAFWVSARQRPSSIKPTRVSNEESSPESIPLIHQDTAIHIRSDLIQRKINLIPSLALSTPFNVCLRGEYILNRGWRRQRGSAR